MALNLLTELSRYVTADIILDRILPYMVRYIYIVTPYIALTALYCNTKLKAVNLLTELSRYVTADIILDRILPYMVRYSIVTPS